MSAGVLYVIQAKLKKPKGVDDAPDWDDTPYDQIESLKTARNTIEVLSANEDWQYRIVKQTREVIK